MNELLRCHFLGRRSDSNLRLSTAISSVCGGVWCVHGRGNLVTFSRLCTFMNSAGLCLWSCKSSYPSPQQPSSSSRFSRSLNVFTHHSFARRRRCKSSSSSSSSSRRGAITTSEGRAARRDANCSRTVSTRATAPVSSGAAFSAASTEVSGSPRC